MAEELLLKDRIVFIIQKSQHVIQMSDYTIFQEIMFIQLYILISLICIS